MYIGKPWGLAINSVCCPVEEIREWFFTLLLT